MPNKSPTTIDRALTAKQILESLPESPWSESERTAIQGFSQVVANGNALEVVHRYLKLVDELGEPHDLGKSLTITEGGKLLVTLDTHAYLGVPIDQILDPVEWIQKRTKTLTGRQRYGPKLERWIGGIPEHLNALGAQLAQVRWSSRRYVPVVSAVPVNSDCPGGTLKVKGVELPIKSRFYVEFDMPSNKPEIDSVVVILERIVPKTEAWSGTASDLLLAALASIRGKRSLTLPEDFPRSPATMGDYLKRNEDVLAQAGFRCEKHRTGTSRTISIERCAPVKTAKKVVSEHAAFGPDTYRDFMVVFAHNKWYAENKVKIAYPNAKNFETFLLQKQEGSN